MFGALRLSIAVVFSPPRSCACLVICSYPCVMQRENQRVASTSKSLQYSGVDDINRLSVTRFCWLFGELPRATHDHGNTNTVLAPPCRVIVTKFSLFILGLPVRTHINHFHRLSFNFSVCARHTSTLRRRAACRMSMTSMRGTLTCPHSTGIKIHDKFSSDPGKRIGRRPFRRPTTMNASEASSSSVTAAFTEQKGCWFANC